MIYAAIPINAKFSTSYLHSSWGPLKEGQIKVREVNEADAPLLLKAVRRNRSSIILREDDYDLRLIEGKYYVGISSLESLISLSSLYSKSNSPIYQYLDHIFRNRHMKPLEKCKTNLKSILIAICTGNFQHQDGSEKHTSKIYYNRFSNFLNTILSSLVAVNGTVYAKINFIYMLQHDEVAENTIPYLGFDGNEKGVVFVGHYGHEQENVESYYLKNHILDRMIETPVFCSHIYKGEQTWEYTLNESVQITPLTKYQSSLLMQAGLERICLNPNLSDRAINYISDIVELYESLNGSRFQVAEKEHLWKDLKQAIDAYKKSISDERARLAIDKILGKKQAW